MDGNKLRLDLIDIQSSVLRVNATAGEQLFAPITDAQIREMCLRVDEGALTSVSGTYVLESVDGGGDDPITCVECGGEGDVEIDHPASCDIYCTEPCRYCGGSGLVPGGPQRGTE